MLSYLIVQLCHLILKHLLKIAELLLMKRQLHLKFLHRLSQFIFLSLVFLPNRGYQGFIFCAQRRLIIFVLFLKHADHVRIIDSHPLNQILVVPLRSGFALERILNLLFKGRIIAV